MSAAEGPVLPRPPRYLIPAMERFGSNRSLLTEQFELLERRDVVGHILR